MEQPPIPSDIDHIENLPLIIKRDVHENSKQYSSKEDFWETIKSAAIIIQSKQKS